MVRTISNFCSRRSALTFTSALASTLIACAPARAQDQAPAASPTSTPAPATTAKPSDNGISDIIVTASRFSQTVQKSSLSILAVDSKELLKRGVTEAKSLNGIAPGVVIGQGGIGNQIYIRGVGDYSVLAYNDLAVSFNLDSVAIARPPAIAGVFFDVNRVEVLKGPQGTLFGRNSTGGAISVITNDPTLDRVSGAASLTLGNYETITTQAALNIPLSSTVAVRAAVQTANHDGYLSDGTDDQNLKAGRVKLLFQPSTAIRLVVSGDYAQQKGKGAGSVFTPLIDPDHPWIGGADPRSNAVTGAGFIPLFPFDQGAIFQNVKTYGVSAQLDADLGFAKLTIIPAYRGLKTDAFQYTPGFGATDTEKESQYSIEARLSNSGPRLKWVVGAYGFRENQRSTQTISLLPVTSGSYDFNAIKDRNYAGFVDATFSVTPRLRVLGGLRYTHEKKSIDGTLDQSLFFTPAPTVPVLGDVSFNKTTWRAGAEFDAAPNSMLYATVATGFRSGGFYAAQAPFNTYQPETLTAYTFGSKNRFFDNKLQFNVELFYWKFANKQINHTGFTRSGSITNVTDNAGKATLKGADVDIVFRPSRSDRFAFIGEYNDSKYDSFVYDTPQLGGPPSVGCPFTVLSPFLARVDCSGRPLERAPKWSGTASYAHTFFLEDGATVEAGGRFRFSSSYYTAVDFRPQQYQKSYQMGDLDLTYTAANKRWSLGAFVQNVTNEHAFSGSFQVPIVNYIYSTILPPRTYGARFNVNF